VFNIFEALYHKILVTIVRRGNISDVDIEICSKTKLLDHTKESFETDSVNEKMLEFINGYTKESPYFYITLLDSSHLQGVIPTCEKTRLSSYADLSASEYKCYEDRWTFYTSKSDLYEIEKLYEPLGVDFIFSPFMILSNFFKDKIETNMALYILIQGDSLSLAVFSDSELLFGEHLPLDIDKELYGGTLSSVDDSEEIDLSESDGIDLEDIDISEDLDDLDELDDLDDFGDIEDLDSLDEIEDFGENQDIEEVFYEAEEEIAEEEGDDHFNDDYQRYALIQNSLGKYYRSDKYNSQFIENVYIADAVGISQELKRYLEEEMFLNVYIRTIELSAEVAEITKKELNICVTAT
jgi:hypothetical protein